MAKRIPLTQGKYAIVDDEDFEWLSKWKWTAMRTYRGAFYAYRKEWPGNKSVLMHREIVKPRAGQWTDHIDGNRLNNRRSNLRRCTPQQNGFNRRSRYSRPPRLKGVHFCNTRRRWLARIRISGKVIYLGSSTSQRIAVHLYQKAAKRLHGKFAYGAR